jgi:hypothetical protein
LNCQLDGMIGCLTFENPMEQSVTRIVTRSSSRGAGLPSCDSHGESSFGFLNLHHLISIMPARTRGAVTLAMRADSDGEMEEDPVDIGEDEVESVGDVDESEDGEDAVNESDGDDDEIQSVSPWP